MKNKAKIFGTIVGIILFAVLMVGITYAWYRWSTNSNEETLIATDVGTVTVKYDAGPSIIGKELYPVSDKSFGIIKGITVKADSQIVNETIFDLYLDINKLDDGLKHSSFKYELYNFKTLISQGNFGNLVTEECNNDNTINHIVLLSGEEITTNLSNYVLYIWIDGTVDNPSSMQKQSFEFSLHAVGKNAIGEEMLYPDITSVQEGTLAYKIVNDYLNSDSILYTTVNEKKYKLDTGNSLLSDIGGNVRYYGSNPKNYIYFNCDEYPETGCETWRIIGVFDDKVKLIKNEHIGSYSWDYNYNDDLTSITGHSNWGKSSLNKLLNEPYLNNSDAEYYNYSSSGPVKIDIGDNFNGKGIKSNAISMIADSTYYLGGFINPMIYVDTAYRQERNAKLIYSGYPVFVNEKIALPYATDYVYATDLDKCKVTLNNNHSTVCKSSNWMKTILGTTETTWLLSPFYTSNIRAWYINSNGAMAYTGEVTEPRNVFPVLYLNADTVVNNVGDGSSGSPYRIVVD